MKGDFLQGHVVIEQKGVGFKLEESRFRLETRNKSVTTREVTGWPEKLWMPHPYRHSRPGGMDP